MAKQLPALTPVLREFIQRQKIFFVASAAPGARVNLSPKGNECLAVLSDNAVAYLDRTGSGNETAAHMIADGRLTFMFCAFEGPPVILRLYGKGTVLHRRSKAFRDLLDAHFDGQSVPGCRQAIRLDFDLVQTSCGYAVPLMDYVEDRTILDDWADQKTEEELEAYWRLKNQRSLDGLPTGLFEEAEALG
ncbi:hypothetical protein QO010_001465 [Caulobacter ginsengisoli]|uniref:Pyridoxamine 5'-phosphate oxidase N-terminal domain-containing protein n=1 Tax=Caulobacter ginsengisoli TaxID=400775 RepID=A0ABU0IRP8_9CAUL|nr:pyridoxamine 5'-phosphate oxidase family protein [Caulobacter ginsengisoli]MDQ0463694.1 hypothetical protein [Caulobacter ginsengisoli]